MIIKEITEEEFDNYSHNHVLRNYYQTSKYANLMKKFGYNPIYIGAFVDDQIKGAALILSKYIAINIKYGYSPRGFLIDYNDYEFLREFTKKIKKYFFKKGYAFIKINPEITLSEINKDNKEKNINEKSIELIKTLEKLNYKKLKDNIYFESLLPKYNPIIRLKTYEFSCVSKNLKQKIRNKDKKGINLIKGDEYNLNEFYELVKNKKDNSIEYYKNYYKIFKEINMADLWLIEVDYHEYLKNAKEEYQFLQEENEEINKSFIKDSRNKNLLRIKMESDKKLTTLNSEITEVNEFLQNGISKQILASALVIKFKTRVNIVISGFDKKNTRLNANYIMYTKLIEHYKKEGYSFLDLNGITADFSKNNPYKGLNDFKLNFNPNIYEYIGEFDLIVNQTLYSLLWTTKILHNEFERKDIKHWCLLYC